MEVKEFTLSETYRAGLEELLLQLSDKERSLDLESSPNTLCIGVFNEEELVGFAQLFLLRKTTFIIGHLEDLIVHSSYRGQGLGKHLLEKVIEIAKREKCSVINLTTRSTRPEAVSLFESLGFQNPGNMVLRLSLDEK